MSAGKRAILPLLVVAYALNFLDRQIVGILKIPIKAELGLSDTQLGLLGGIAFAALYSTLAIPFARYADRNGRAKVIAWAVAVWSGFTALCALAAGFWSLFFARMGVGVGEAGGVAPSYALIADHVPPERRARALAIFSLGIPIGSALGLFFGGWIAQAINWRMAFVIVGIGGLPVAWAIRRFVPEAPRETRAQSSDRLRDVLRALAAKPTFWLLSLGAASGSICGYGLAFWLPSFFSEGLGLSLGAIGSYFGSIVLVGGSAGILLGGVIADRLGAARPGAYAATPAFAYAIAAPTFAAAMLVTSPVLAWWLFALAYALSLAWLGPIVTAVQSLVEPARRATASSLFLLINNLVGIGFGTFIFGFSADQLRPLYGTEAMRYALLLGLGFYLFAAFLCGLASAAMRHDRLRLSA